MLVPSFALRGDFAYGTGTGTGTTTGGTAGGQSTTRTGSTAAGRP